MFFFFQAEDGIRDADVTGVQTCALPISFVWTPTVNAGPNPSAVAVGYFNGDPYPDLAVTNSGSNTVSVLLGNGVGGFTGGQILTVGNTPEAVTVGDFNGDKIPDLAVANYGCGGGYYSCPPGTSPSTTVTVLLGQGDGTFDQSTALTLNMGLWPNSISGG